MRKKSAWLIPIAAVFCCYITAFGAPKKNKATRTPGDINTEIFKGSGGNELATRGLAGAIPTTAATFDVGTDVTLSVSWQCGPVVFDETNKKLFAASKQVQPTIRTAGVNPSDATKTYGRDYRPFTLIRVEPSATVGTAPTITPLVSVAEDATLNAAVSQSHPLRQAVVNNMVMLPDQSGDLVVTCTLPVDKTQTSTAAAVYIVKAKDSTGSDAKGKTLLSSDRALRDKNGSVVNRSIMALAAGPAAINDTNNKQRIFAATSANNYNWEDLDTANVRGIAVLKVDTNKIRTQQANKISTDAIDATSELFCSPINTLAADLVTTQTVGDGGRIAFNATGNVDNTAYNGKSSGIAYAEVGPKVNMQWVDNTSTNTMGNLYVGLSGVKRDNPVYEGGVCSTLVGRVDGSRLILAPIIKDLNKNQLYDVDTYNKVKAAWASKRVADLVTRAVKTPNLDGSLKHYGGNSACLAARQEVANIIGIDPSMIVAENQPAGENYRTWDTSATSTAAYDRFIKEGIQAAEAQIITACQKSGPLMSLRLTNTAIAPIVLASTLTLTAATSMYYTSMTPTAAMIQAANKVAKAYADQVPADLSGLNNDHLIVGYYGDGDPTYGGDIDVRISNNLMRNMHTSTGKDYVIVNAAVGRPAYAVAGGSLYSQSREGLFALPVLANQKWNTETKTYENWTDQTNGSDWCRYTGTLSSVDPVTYTATFDAPPTDINHMPRDDKDPFIVGGKLFGRNQHVSDMFVVGDSVYMCCSGYNAYDAGIFQSAALFDGNGAIIGWTPMQRVMGDTERVFGGNVNKADGSFAFVASKANNKLGSANTARQTDQTGDSNEFYASSNNPKVTQWDAGGTNKRTNRRRDGDTTAKSDLANAISNITPRLMFPFDERTPGFAQGKFSMMLAVSQDSTKLDLIQTSTFQNGSLKPIKDYYKGSTPAGDDNIFEFDISALNLGIITTAEVSRTTSPFGGWLFVGGVEGVAVLSNDDVTYDSISKLVASATTRNTARSKAFNNKFVRNNYASGFAAMRELVDSTYTTSDKKGVLAALDTFYTTTITGITKQATQGKAPNTNITGFHATWTYLNSIAGQGRGWVANSGLRNLEFQGTNNVFPYGKKTATAAAFAATDLNWSFKKLTPTTASDFKGTRKLLSDGTSLYIVTLDKIYSVPLNNATYFAKQTGATTNITNGVHETLVLDANTAFPTATYFMDLISLNNGRTLIIATTQGLFAATRDPQNNSYVINEVLARGQSLGPVVHMNFFSKTKGVNTVPGNLYALAANFVEDTGYIYRFHVNVNSSTGLTEISLIPSYKKDSDGNITLQTNPYLLDLSHFYLTLFTDGGFIASAVAFNENADILKLGTISDTTSAAGASTYMSSDITNLGIPFRDSATGAIIIPTNKGVYLND